MIMETKIQAIHFEATQQLVDFINKKVDKLVRKNPAIADASVNLRVVKPETQLNKEAVVRIAVPHAGEFVVTKVANSFEEAVDTALAAIEPQLEKLKDKH